MLTDEQAKDFNDSMTKCRKKPDHLNIDNIVSCCYFQLKKTAMLIVLVHFHVVAVNTLAYYHLL